MSTFKRIKALAKKPINLIIIVLVLLIFSLLTIKLSIPAPNTHSQPTPSPSPSNYLNGIYKGDLPCADCPSITETLILAADNSYILEDLYQEKSDKPLQAQGKWEIINSNILKLNSSDNSDPQYLQILEDGNLEMLDSNMQKIDSPASKILTKKY